MTKLARCFVSILGLSAILLLFPRESHAYVDPGTGSYALQVIIAGIAAGSLGLKLFWGKVRSLFRAGREAESRESNEETGRIREG